MDDIEVVISDDASSDNTEETVERYKKRLIGIRYFKHKQNMGLDRNFLFIVEKASNGYVWLLGDDDRLEPNALTTVLSQLRKWPAVCGLTLGVIDYNHDLTHPSGMKNMPDTVQLQGAKEVFGKIVDLIACMSATVVNRRLWLEACKNNPVMNYTNLYIQVYIIGCMVGEAGIWGVLNVPCVGFRSDNDQFLSKVGWLRRLEIDVTSYNQIFNGIFSENSDFVETLDKQILKTHVMARLYNGKSGNVGYGEFLKAFFLLYKFYRRIDLFWKKAVPILIMPSWAVRILRGFYQKYSPKSGTQRAKALLNGA